MPHFPKPFYKKARGCWYIEIDRKQYKLGSCTEEEAWDAAAKLKEKLRCHQRVDVQSEKLVVRNRSVNCIFPRLLV